ncbi:Bud-site selection protein [Annulohypoxylon maeteangense]|uniref:Bud-site selection protein n=1 Tax=Annulohypoxylon maeteangense TaxID=1927788 RepID=UPI0020088774|nr:Bud-site selection protein [Annulohypoxylon maeteangense]KAI0888285.1 Bud-site selection protein [Annulohypoxylon maeteangense]
MPKRKRSYEPTLSEKLTQWHKELARGMKTAKGFERQRLSKRIREAQAQGTPDKAARLEREVAVLKSLDLQQAAHAHLCSSLLKIKGVAESPRLPSDLVRPIPKPDGLSEEEKAALHNVTSALCNRKQIRDVIEEAIMGTCMALRVLMPDKMKKGGKDKKDKKERTKEKEGQTDERDDGAKVVGRGKEKEDEEQAGSGEEEPEPVLLKRKRDNVAEEEQEVSGDEEDEPEDEEPFEGFSGSDAEERVWSRYDAFVAGSSSDEDESDEDGASEDALAADSKSRSVRKTTTADDIFISSADSASEDEDEDEEDLDISGSESSASASLPPPKKSKTARSGPISVNGSAFLPSLMGGYISGSESEASDIDVNPPERKNRRGQRARQAIWEKKYKEKAKHLQNQDKGRDQGWDMRRGAVGDDDGSNKPWKKGIHNPFENKDVHPERLRQMQGGGSGGRRFEERRPMVDKPRPKAPTKRDDTGPLHPSWAAAKKAKEEAQKVEFQGRKVVFD